MSESTEEIDNTNHHERLIVRKKQDSEIISKYVLRSCNGQRKIGQLMHSE